MKVVGRNEQESTCTKVDRAGRNVVPVNGMTPIDEDLSMELPSSRSGT